MAGRGNIKKDFESLVEESISNIRDDRDKTNSLLKDLIEYALLDKNKHAQISLSIAKYLETLQRSNEQLVKLTSLLKKSIKDDNGELPKTAIDELFKEIQNGE